MCVQEVVNPLVKEKTCIKQVFFINWFSTVTEADVQAFAHITEALLSEPNSFLMT